MPVLRSREIPPAVPPKPRKARANVDPPATPTQGREQPATFPSPSPSPYLPPGSGSDSTPSLRRSLRLASKDSSSSADHVERRDGNVSRKRKLIVDCNGGFESEESKGFLSFSSGKRVTQRSSLVGDDNDGGRDGGGDKEVESDKKGKCILMEETQESKDVEILERNHEKENANRKRRFSAEEKGKGKLVVETGLESEADGSIDDSVSGVNPSEEKVIFADEKLSNNNRRSGGRREQYRDTARQNASRFAHFNAHEEDNNNSSVEAEREFPSEEHPEENVVEDWPGPFSTAMKIISDRENLNLRQGSDKVQSVQIKWVPKKGKGNDRLKPVPPSLIGMCLRILVNNVDAIASLDHVPDALRHKLCQMLCDSRRMNSKFLDHLVRGSPTEIRLRDCSWLTEEQFTQCFEGCDTTNLTVYFLFIIVIVYELSFVHHFMS